MKRQYPDQPIVGVAGIVFQGEEVVLIRRGQEPGRGEWSLPGGAVEVGETLEAALRREVWEETGLQVDILGLTAVVNRIVKDQAGTVTYHYILLDFLCQVGAGQPRSGSDSAAVILIPYSQLATLGLARQTAAVIQQARQQLAAGAHLPPLLLTD